MKKLILLMVLISMFLIGIVSATPQLALITTTWQENTMVNLSTKSANDGSLINMSYIQILFSASDTANSSTSTIINITNTTATNFDLGYANFTFKNGYVLEDTSKGSVTGKSTGLLGGGSVDLSATTVNVDRTSPSAPTTSHSADTEFDDVNTKTITYAVTGTDTTSCRIAFGKSTFSGSNTFAMTHSGDTCTYTVTKATIPDDVYTTYVQASDGTNTSTSAGRNFKIKTFEGAAADEISALSVPIAQKVMEQVNLGTAALVIILGVFGYMAFFKKQ